MSAHDLLDDLETEAAIAEARRRWGSSGAISIADQYAQSHRFWAPDSRHFVYFGYPTTARDENKPVPATIWIADAKTAKVRRVADGRAGFWSPK